VSAFPEFSAFLVATAPEASEETLRSAWALFATLSALLGLLVVLVAMLVTVRRRRARNLRRKSGGSEPLADPWREAGRRAEG
jgi:threonine/homoserine/homoserine lactone efflux protein